LEIRHPATQARAPAPARCGCAHGDVRTPAFVPLATKAVVKTLEVREAAELGFDMVLGNTFHLFLTPGHELIKQLGGLHRFQRWDRPIITDSGGFQVFSMGHGTVADEIKGRRGAVRRRALGRDPRDRGGGRALSLLPRRLDQVHGPGDLDGGPGRARLGHRAGLRRVHAVPRRPRVHRALDRAHASLAGSLPAMARPARTGGQTVYGIVQGGTDEDLRRSSAQAVAARDALGGIAIGGTLGEDKDADVRGRRVGDRGAAGGQPRHLLGIGEVDDLVRGVELGIDTFDCAMPTRIGRHGMALVPDPGKRWRVDLAKAAGATADEPLLEGCPCPACEHGYSRAYLHYLLRAREQTAQRLLTIHNLAYLQRLMAGLRAATDAGTLADAAAAVYAGAAPWELPA
jgi:queuine tRNA-ribosyltransferase